jgi:hypothetical protein
MIDQCTQTKVSATALLFLSSPSNRQNLRVIIHDYNIISAVRVALQLKGCESKSPYVPFLQPSPSQPSPPPYRFSLSLLHSRYNHGHVIIIAFLQPGAHLHVCEVECDTELRREGEVPEAVGVVWVLAREARAFYRPFEVTEGTTAFL